MLLSDHERSDMVVARRNIGIPSDRGSGSRGSRTDLCRVLRRFVMIPGGGIIIAIVAAAALMEVSRLALLLAPYPREHLPAESTALDAIVFSEVLTLWLPPALTELATNHSDFGPTHEALQRYLERQHQTSVWYAIAIRDYHANGRIDCITYIRRPYDVRAFFQEFLDVLQSAAGKQPSNPTSDFSRALVRVIPQELLNQNPIVITTKYLERSSPEPVP